MRHATIDLPREIEKALRDDTLVVFAGAGVSRGAASALPDFEGLVQCIAFGSILIRGGSVLMRPP